MTTVNDAKTLAENAHRGQKYGSKPYMYHVSQVVALAQPYGEAATILAYLHDVVEDTSVSLENIENQFGSEVAKSLLVLTDPDIKDRQQRKEQSHQKLAMVDPLSEQRWALIVKAADRLANTQACIADNYCKKIDMYRSEYPAFKKAAYRPNLCDELWTKLDEAYARLQAIKR